MKDKPLISIIMPVHNAEVFLAKSIESILHQTFLEIELICVNDGSSDESLKVLKKYASVDNRMVVIDKQNEGVSQARNDGLKAASADYIMFVDADDWIDRETCAIAYREIQIYDADVVIWSYVSEAAEYSSEKILFNDDILFVGDEVKTKIYRRLIGPVETELAHPELVSSLCPVWGKLYKKSIIISSKAKFVDLEKIGTYEDGLFNLDIFKMAQKVVYINKPYYHYRKINRNSVTASYNENLIAQWKNLYMLIQEHLEEISYSDEYKVALRNRKAVEVLGAGLNAVSSTKGNSSIIKEIKNILNDEQTHRALMQLNFKYFPAHWKLFYSCAKYKLILPFWILLVVIQKVIRRKDN
ncbi:hypothetical protein JCM17039_03560 [Blautia glucerasea]